MSKLRDNLSSLKSKLQDMGKQIEEQSSAKAIKEAKQKSLEEKFSEITLTDRKIVNLNIGGKIFATTYDVLTKDPNCLFSILLKENPDSNTLYFDRNPRIFDILLSYLRFGKIKYTQYSDIELKEIYEEALYYEITDIRDYLFEKTRDITVIKVETSGEYFADGKVVGDNNHLSLSDKDMKKGICAKSPGWITMELNCNSDFSTLEIGGYCGNEKVWYKGNGAGAQILVSENGKDWTLVGRIPTKFGYEITSVNLDKEVKNAKYIKFNHLSYLGIGYLNIIKDS